MPAEPVITRMHARSDGSVGEHVMLGRQSFRDMLLAVSVLLTLVLLAVAAPVSAQTPVASPQATPVPAGFMLVATVGADEWREPLPEPRAGVDLGDRTLLEALREGSFVIYFRHAATDTSYDRNVDLENCATQRNLSQLGKEQAAAIGAGFEELGIPVGEVLSSEYCRARETAEIAFGEVTLEPALTPFVGKISEGAQAEQTAALADLLSMPPEAGTNRVIVAHQHNITEAAGVELDEGEAAVFLSAEQRTHLPSRSMVWQEYASGEWSCQSSVIPWIDAMPPRSLCQVSILNS